MKRSLLSRRDLLRAGVLGAAAAVLAACGASAPSPSRSPASSRTPTAPPSPSGVASATAGAPPADPPSPTPVQPTLRQKIAGIIVVGFRGSTLAQAGWVRTALADTAIRGVILFDRDQLTGKSRNV